MVGLESLEKRTFLIGEVVPELAFVAHASCFSSKELVPKLELHLFLLDSCPYGCYIRHKYYAVSKYASVEVLEVVTGGLDHLGVKAAGVHLKQPGLDFVPVGLQLLRARPAGPLKPPMVDKRQHRLHCYGLLRFFVLVQRLRGTARNLLCCETNIAASFVLRDLDVFEREGLHFHVFGVCMRCTTSGLHSAHSRSKSELRL